MNPEVLARANNRTREFAKKTTGNSEILQRRWLPIDLDPQRPTGISATGPEHEAAVERASRVKAWLTELGWPEPVTLDSGNGAYLLYHVDLPNDQAATHLITGCLTSLDAIFSDEQVKIDAAVGKPAQLVRVPGTVNSKGDDVPERPHRIVRLLQVPDQLRAVGRDLLDRVAAAVPAIPPEASKANAQSSFDLDRWITQHALTVTKTKPWNGGTLVELEKCPWNPDHTRTARIIRFANGALSAGCFKDSCQGKGWRALRDAVELGSGEDTVEAPAGAEGQSRGRPSQAKQLVALAEGDEFFHCERGDVGYATVAVNDHYETWPIRSKGYRRWLIRRFYELKGKPPGNQAIADALGCLESKAQFDGPQRSVSLRVGGDGDTVIYLDLANERWEAIEITAVGWRVVADSPIKFLRSRGMQSLPRPVPGGSLDLLRPYVNVAEESDWRLFVSWLIGSLRPHGPYAVLPVYGGHGSGKSILSRIARDLLDPNSAPLRAEPRDVRDVMIAASNSWMLAFDNLSYLPSWLSDALCRLATGGGLATRELYTDGDETLFFASRPILLNGIEEMITRPDLLDRALILHLPAIDPAQRRPEREFWRNFEALRPQIIGVLCDAVSMALSRQAEVDVKSLPRMADFATWVTAAEPAFGWVPGTFIDDYASNGHAAHVLALDASPVAQAVLSLTELDDWNGTASDLLEALNERLNDQTKRLKSWPQTPHALGNALRRLAPTLKAVGAEVEWLPRTASQRPLRIRRCPDSGVTPVISVTNPGEAPMFDHGIARPGSSRLLSQATSRNTAIADARDDHDEDFRDLSDPEETGTI